MVGCEYYSFLPVDVIQKQNDKEQRYENVTHIFIPPLFVVGGWGRVSALSPRLDTYLLPTLFSML